MGNILRGEIFCPTDRNELERPLKQTMADFSKTDDINDLERSSDSFGVVPKSKVSTEELLCGSLDGIRTCSNVESETSTLAGDEKTSDWKDSKLRKRGNAIEVKPIDRPTGKFLPGKQYYLQNAELQWEAVTIESWNFWNGTWQVRGENGVAFPATPTALKSEEEYRFFTMERSFSFRSFSSMEEICVK